LQGEITISYYNFNPDQGVFSITLDPLRKNLGELQCYMPCPCLKLENDEHFCLNGDEVNDIHFVDFGFLPTCPCSDKDTNKSLCLNMVYTDTDGFIRCGTSKRRILLRKFPISIEDYLNAVRCVMEFYSGDLIKVNKCPECLYKTIVNIFLKRLA